MTYARLSVRCAALSAEITLRALLFWAPLMNAPMRALEERYR